MPKQELVQLSWPRQGLVENAALMEQPEGTTTDCLNVRAYDALDRRNRGGQRTGLSRVIDAQVNGDADIQVLLQTVESVPLAEAANVGSKFADASPTINAATFGSIAWHPDGDFIAFSNGGGTGRLGAVAFSGTTGFGTQFKPTEDSSAWSGIAWSNDGNYLFAVADGSITGGGTHRLVAWSFSKTTGFGSIITPSVAITTNNTAIAFSPDGGALVYVFNASPYIRAIRWTGTAFGAAYSDPGTAGIQIVSSGAFNEACTFNTAGTVVFQGGDVSPFVRAWNWTDASGFGSAFSDPGTPPTNNVDSIRHHPTTGHVIISDADQARVYPFSTGSGWGTRESVPEDAGADSPRCVNFSPSGNFLVVGQSTTGIEFFIRAFDGTVGARLTDPATLPTDTPHSIAWSPNGSYLAMHRGPNTQAVNVYNFTEAQSNPSARRVRLVALAGGSLYRTDTNLTAYALVNNGGTALKTSGLVRASTAFQDVFFADGTEQYKYYDLSSNSVLSWRDALTSGDLPFGSTNTAVDITGVNTGTPSFTVAEDLSSLEAGDIIIVTGSNIGNYKVVSTSGTGPTTIIVTEAIPSATVDGTLVQADEGATIIATYRGRVVLAGLRSEPQNWFMSVAGDPFNYNYSPATTSATQAVAGNNSTAGQLGDVLTALAPYLDDILIMGGANTLWVMRGDPAAGGAIDNVSREIGIVGPEAWTFDTSQRFYFFGRNGLYRMDLNSYQPVLISQNKLDNTFAAVDVSTKVIRLVYDPVWQGVHIFISDETVPSTASRHYFFDERNEAFWPDEYPVDVGPSAVEVFLADNPENTAVYMGGYDGRVRQFKDSATNDDGTAIASRCRFTPIVPGNVVAVSRVEDVTIVTDRSGGNVVYKHFAADTVEQAELEADNNTPKVQKTLPAGRAAPIRQRVSQNAHILELSSPTAGSRWAYEQGICKAAILDRIKGRRV